MPARNTDEIQHVLENGLDSLPDRFTRFGRLAAFGKEEDEEFQGLIELLTGYVTLKSPTRPLCIGVFGPPGAGKSFAVKELVSWVDKKTSAAMQIQTFNLTQILRSSDLSKSLGKSTRIEEKALPVCLFDEFDSPLAGAPFGWLSWFLAPMQDGHFEQDGTPIKVQRAVFFFAGGTASSFSEFGRTDPDTFRAAKGPDFVSRLRGTLDIRGVNERANRDFRRALVLRKALVDRRAALEGQESEAVLPISVELLNAFLNAGRFRHGARSVAAIVEMCKVHAPGAGSSPLVQTDLPVPYLLMRHVDRGPLDPREIGGGIGFSGGADPDRQKSYEKAWRAVAKALWEQGATLVYGGHAEKGGLTDLLQRTLRNLPHGPLHPIDAETPPRLRWIDVTGEAVAKTGQGKVVSVERVPATVNPGSPARPDLQRRIQEATSDPSLRTWLEQSLRLYRLRRQMNDQCVARVVIGGKPVGYSGRLPGIVEEAALALHAQQPIYVVGGYGGAAAAVGMLLGLGARPSGGASCDLRAPFSQVAENGRTEDHWLPPESALRLLSDLFDSSGARPLPLTFGEALDFLWSCAIGGPAWVDNGLSRAENRRLFDCTDPGVVSDLIIRGLTRMGRRQR